MSRKNVITAYKILDAESLAANFESNVTNIEYLDNVGIQIVTDSVTDNTGQFSIQVSNDNVTFEDITVTPTISALADTDTQIFVNLNQLPFSYVRIKFAAAGGTPDGTATAFLTAKEL